MVVKKDSLPDPLLDLPRTLKQDREFLARVEVPIVTTSASFKSDIARNFGEKSKAEGPDIVFSRGHFSMAVAIFRQAYEMKLSTWLVDPINYTSPADWGKLRGVVIVGRIVARFPIIKHIKDLMDTLIRGKLPISEAINTPLLYATSTTTKPIISIHYETGNILAREGRTVLQVITDPQVRPQYLQEAERKNMTFAVFNNQTKEEFLEKARQAGKKVDSERIVVTGPPVNPQIVRSRSKKTANPIKNRPLRLAITTGGLGQNKEEISDLLDNIGPLVKEGSVQVALYASTLPSFREMYENIISKFNILLGSDIADQTAPARIIYSSSIVEANQALVSNVFPWADGFVTKPSGDMAYDAAAAGCFILGLEPWGDWEVNVEKIFTDLSILKRAEPKNFSKQLEELSATGWISQATKNALKIDKLFLSGAKNIVALQQKIAKS